MCEYWNAETWLARSKPASSHSSYALVATRYSQGGDVARTYTDTSDGWGYAVLPDSVDGDEVTQATFTPSQAALYGTTTADAALAYIERHGFTQAEPQSLDATTGNLVENLA